MTEAANSAVAIRALRKSFGATLAVDDVSFTIEQGTAHALLGENGAGKSTIVKLLSGLIEPDRGTISVFGDEVRLRSPRVAHRHGVQTAFQEMTLTPDLTVLDNMLLPYGPQGWSGMISAAPPNARFASISTVSVSTSSCGAKSANSISRFSRRSRSRARSSVARAFCCSTSRPRRSPAATSTGSGEVIAHLKRRGVTILFISHRMREVRAFCDHVTILRNGRHIATAAASELTDTQIIEMIIGRSITQTFPPRPQHGSADAPEVLGARDLAAGHRLEAATFSLKRGEILGVAGLQGMGQLDLFLACFGMTDVHAGDILVDGRPVTIASPTDALRPNIGMGFLPEDRKTEALFVELDGKHNASLPIIERFCRFGLVQGAREETRRRRRVRARRSRSPRAVDASQILFRRQSAKDRARQMAAGAKPDLAAVRSHTRYRCRHQARTLCSHARLR